MSRLSFGLVLLVGILAGGLGVSMLDRGPAPIADADVRGIVTEMLAADASNAELDPAALNTMIEDYLMGDPAILERMSAKLNAAKRLEQRQQQVALLDANYATIYEDPANVVIGNPRGDVTLVEMFDYNCGYCRRALPDLAALIAEDPNLKIILKEFPILSEGSVEAAKIAYLVAEDDNLDYWAFHQEPALTAAEAVGGSRVALMIDMNGKPAADALQRSYDLATALKISGTPTFIIGDEVIPGAVGLDALRDKIANMRACGSTVCDVPAG
jgi:protein-disulfide isomerase